MFVANAVLNGLPEVRRECAPAAKIERAAPPKRAENGVLDEVGSVGRRPNPPRQSMARPARQGRKTSADEPAERSLIADACSIEQPPR
jgi:hypothetical protein